MTNKLPQDSLDGTVELTNTISSTGIKCEKKPRNVRRSHLFVLYSLLHSNEHCKLPSPHHLYSITGCHADLFLIMMILTTQLQRQRGGAFAFFSHRLTSATSLKVPVSKITTPFASRSFANSGRPLRGYAQYIVHTEATMFSLRAILPVFKNVKGESIGADMTKKGKILIELTPRGTNGYVWADQVKFALTAEELGLICSQLPQVGVEFVRTSRNSQDYDYSGVTGMGGDLPDKVLRISPGDGCTVIFTADFVKDGVGGHSPMPSYSGPPVSCLIIQQ